MNDRFEWVVQASPDLIFRLDRDGNFLDYYHTQSKLLMVSADQIIGKNLKDYFEPSVVKNALHAIASALSEKKDTRFEYSLQLPLGTYFFEARMIPTSPGEVVSFIRDITENYHLRKKNEDILSNITDLIFWISRDGTYKDFFVGNSQDLLIDKKNILGAKVSDTFPEELAMRVMDKIKEAHDSHHTQIFEYQIQVNGVDNFFETTLIPSDSETVVAFVRNISTQKETQLRMMEQNKLLEKQNAELLKINQEMDSFMYSTSHDLRAPLSSILGLVDIGMRTRDLKEAKSCLSMIKDRVIVQDNVIHEILDYAKNLRTELKIEKINLKFLVYQIIDTLLFNKGADKIDFQIELPDDLEIVTDKDRLTIIINNLLANSINYCDEHKVNKYVRISMENERSKITIHITDNGYGIGKEHHHNIFRMFFRASEKSKGSGLGLFIVKETLQKLSGEISFTSSLGQGSSFSFSLPREEAALEIGSAR